MQGLYMRKFLICLMFIGCSRAPTHTKQVTIDPYLYPFVANFLQEAKMQGLDIRVDDLSVQFSTSGPDLRLGLCAQPIGETPEVTISLKYWDIYDNDVIHRAVMFHELGHCLLKRPHLNDMEGPGHGPTSIMYYLIFVNNPELYSANWEYYMKELFQ